MGDNSRCSVEHWEPKKWEGWPAFLRVGKETSYAHRQWNHSPAQISLSHVCLRVRSPRHRNHRWALRWPWWARDGASLGQAQLELGMGRACTGGGRGGRERGPFWRSHLVLTVCTRWLVGGRGAPPPMAPGFFHSPSFHCSYVTGSSTDWDWWLFFHLVAGISWGLDWATSPHKSGEQFLEVLAARGERYPTQ